MGLAQRYGGVIPEPFGSQCNEKEDKNIQKLQIILNNQNDIEEIKQKLTILKQEKIGSVYYLIIKEEQEKIKNELNRYNPTLMEFLPLTLEEVFMFENGGEENV